MTRSEIVTESEANTIIAKRRGWTGEHENVGDALNPCLWCGLEPSGFQQINTEFTTGYWCDESCLGPAYHRNYEALSTAEREVYGGDLRNLLIAPDGRRGWCATVRLWRPGKGESFKHVQGCPSQLHARAACLAKAIEAGS